MTMLTTTWEPAAEYGRDEIVRASDRLLAKPDLPITAREDLFRIDVAGLGWDIGGMVYEPTDPEAVPLGADGKKVGIFLMHGGSGDHRCKDAMARLIAS